MYHPNLFDALKKKPTRQYSLPVPETSFTIEVKNQLGEDSAMLQWYFEQQEAPLKWQAESLVIVLLH
jgi:hypothetical protein